MEEMFSNLGLGLSVALSFQNLLYALFGAVLGTLIGVLPGLGPVATIAMLLPSIYALDDMRDVIQILAAGHIGIKLRDLRLLMFFRQRGWQ